MGAFRKALVAAFLAVAAYEVYDAHEAAQQAQIKQQQAQAAEQAKQAEIAKYDKITYSEFLNDLKADEVSTVTIYGEGMTGTLKDNPRPFMTQMPEGEQARITDRLEEKNVKFQAVDAPKAEAAQPGTTPAQQQPASGNPFSNLGFDMQLAGLALTAAFIGVIIWSVRKQMGGAKSLKGQVVPTPEATGIKNVTFADVAGCDEAKEDLQEIIDFLHDPTKAAKLGGKMPKGVLLSGPPGTGKTLLARAVAGEAKVPFYHMSGSDFVEMFVGVGAARVRELFDTAKKNAPCVIFIDEIDAVGRQRGGPGGSFGGHDEREQTLNQLLVAMDGFEPNSGVVVIAATNRPDVLDEALTRAGRFDRQITVPLPDVVGREAILKVHAAKVPLAPSVTLRDVARGTPGFAGADLANLVNEAALLAGRRGKNAVEWKDFEDAKDKILMGAEHRTLLMSDREKKNTAYHEGAHALVAYFHREHADPIHKATIIPRGQALGMVMQLPEGDRVSMTLAKLKADMAIAAAGRIGEELAFGRENITTGASSDIRAITNMSTRMVREWAMSDSADLTMLNYSPDDGGDFFQQAAGAAKGLSEEKKQLLDAEIHKLVSGAYQDAYNILTTHRDALDRLANALMEYETLTGDEVGKVIRNEPLDREKPTPLPPPNFLPRVPPPGPAPGGPA